MPVSILSPFRSLELALTSLLTFRCKPIKPAMKSDLATKLDKLNAARDLRQIFGRSNRIHRRAKVNSFQKNERMLGLTASISLPGERQLFSGRTAGGKIALASIRREANLGQRVVE